MFLAIIAQTYDEAQEAEESPLAREFRQVILLATRLTRLSIHK